MGIFHFCPLEKLKITWIEVEAYQEVQLQESSPKFDKIG